MSVHKSIVVVACLSLMLANAVAQEGVKGATVRPRQEKANVSGCKIAAPGPYEVSVGDLIELDYTYPVVPEATPKKVDYKQTLSGAVTKSSLGFRAVRSPMVLGVGTIAFYFDAKKEGTESVTILIDDAEYKFDFTVKKSD